MAALAGSAWGAPRRPNIVIFLSEGHAAADLTPEITPHLHGMASSSLHMKLAFATEAMASPSKSSLLTGLYPPRHGAYEEFSFVRRDLGATWPVWFAAQGYRVTLAGVPGFGPRQVFPFEYQPLDSVSRYLRLPHNKPFCLVISLPGLEDFPAGPPSEAPVPGYAVDTPETRRWMGRYRGSLRAMDRLIGEILPHIQENTITVYTSAHGPSLPFAKWSLYDAGIRVPLLIRWPGVTPAAESEAMVSLIDVLPTLLEACGGAPPAGIDGASFLPVLTGRAVHHRQEIYAVHHNRGSVSGSDCPMRAVRTKRQKFIVNLKHWVHFGNIWWRGNDGSDSRDPVRRPPPALWQEWLFRSAKEEHAANRTALWRVRPAAELYDLQSDPHELKNLAVEEEFAAVRAELHRKLAAWMTAQKDNWLGFLQ